MAPAPSLPPSLTFCLPRSHLNVSGRGRDPGKQSLANSFLRSEVNQRRFSLGRCTAGEPSGDNVPPAWLGPAARAAGEVWERTRDGAAEPTQGLRGQRCHHGLCLGTSKRGLEHCREGRKRSPESLEHLNVCSEGQMRGHRGGWEPAACGPSALRSCGFLCDPFQGSLARPPCSTQLWERVEGARKRVP